MSSRKTGLVFITISFLLTIFPLASAQSFWDWLRDLLFSQNTHGVVESGIVYSIEPTYPTDRWDRIWFDMTLSQMLAETPDQPSLFFDEDWHEGLVAGIRADDIGFTSGRTINLPFSGEYVFYVGSDDGIRVWIDGDLVLDKWFDRGYIEEFFAKTLNAGNHRFRIDYYENKGPARVMFKYSPVQPSWPHISIVLPSSVLPNQEFEVNLTYTEDTNQKGGIHLRWLDEDFDITQKADCDKEYYDNPPFAPGWEGIECSNIDSGTTKTFKLKALSTGTKTLYYRAWNFISYSCGSRFDYRRDPSTGTCSPNCDLFSDDWEICDAYTKNIIVTICEGDDRKPHINYFCPSSATLNQKFECTQTYTHDKNSKGGIHFHWNSSQADYVSLSGCSPTYGGVFYMDYNGNSCSPGSPNCYGIVECSEINSGTTAKLTLNPKTTGNLIVYHRAWDMSMDTKCTLGCDYDRDPSTGTCSSNCSEFPKDMVKCNAYSTSTSVTSSQPTTKIQCDSCFARSKCTCSLATTCNNGIWNLQNKEGRPLSSGLTFSIPPSIVEFDTQQTGKISVIAICFVDSNVETHGPYILEVKEPFLECDEECEPLNPCTCKVNGCNDGYFTAVVGTNIIKWKEKIDKTDYTTSFISQKPGVVDVSVVCNDPLIHTETQIPVSGMLPEKNFSVMGFTSNDLDGLYRLVLNYTNNFVETVRIVFTISKEGIAINNISTAERGLKTKSLTLDCKKLGRGIYTVSWKIFKDPDKTKPIAWSRPEEVVEIEC